MKEQFITTVEPDGGDADARRRRRGLVMAATTKITRNKQGNYKVRSESGESVYTIGKECDTCTCPDFALTKKPCKHIYRALLFIQQEEEREGHDQIEDGKSNDSPKAPKRKTYPQNWPKYELAQTHELEHFDPLLWELCSLLIQPQHRHFRPPLPIADVVYAIVTKAERGMSRRRSMTDIRRARDLGYVDHVPTDSSISRYLGKSELTPVLKWLIIQSALPLTSQEHDFAIDSSGIGSTTYDRWYDAKWGKIIRQAQWVKMHLLVGVKTHIVVAADVSEGDANDSPYLQRLVDDIKDDYDIRELSADKAYLSKGNYNYAAANGIDLYIPFKINSRRQHPKRRRSRAWEQAIDYFNYRRDDFLEHYHKRSIRRRL